MAGIQVERLTQHLAPGDRLPGLRFLQPFEDRSFPFIHHELLGLGALSLVEAVQFAQLDEARDKAARKLIADGNTDLATKVRQFQFRDIRPKAASEIEDISHASRLLGHSKEEITKRVYRRVGEVVSPTK